MVINHLPNGMILQVFRAYKTVFFPHVVPTLGEPGSPQLVHLFFETPMDFGTFTFWDTITGQIITGKRYKLPSTM